MWLIFAALGAFDVPGAVCDPPPPGLVGWWAGDGDATDLAGTNHGSLQGGALATGAGEVGSAFSFDGTNGFVQIPDAPTLRPTNLTIETWVRFDSLDSIGNATPGLQYLVFKQNSRVSNFEGFSLGKGRVSGSDYFVFAITSATAQQVSVVSVSTVSTGVWYHVAGVRGSNFVQLYVNGQLERQTSIAFPQDYGNYPLMFGSSGQPSWDRKLKGSLDEVSLYDRALGSNELTAIYAAGAAGKCKPLRIIAQPQDQAVVSGQEATFTVAASGSTPLGYQWRFNSTSIQGAVGSSLILGVVQPTNAGNYSVVVTNSSGAATSTVAVLNVLVPPSVAVQPHNRTNLAGSTAGFDVAAAGTAPLSFVWRLNGANLYDNGRILGSASNSLSIAGVQTADQGYYSVLVSNSAGVSPSALAKLTVLAPPVLSAQPANLSVVAGANASFQVAASGTPPLSYQWRRDGAVLTNAASVTGATSAVLNLAGVHTSDAGNYQAVVTNGAGSITSLVATLTVTLQPVAPNLTAQPTNQTVDAGAAANFSVSATGTSPLNYQWQKDGLPLSSSSNVPSVTNATLTISNLTTNDSGGYRAVVTNTAGAVTSSIANLVVNQPVILGADAVVLVNSASAKYQDFQHYVQPYLENFGVPYTVVDLATNGAGTNLGLHSLILIGHKQLDTNHTFLTTAVQSLLSAAVFNGTGLVNFDSDLSLASTAPRYQFVQDLFGFGYSAPASASSVSFPATEPLGTMHYVTSLHPTNETMPLSNSMSVASVALGSNSTAVALSSGRPLVVAGRYGQGRAVQWTSYDWMSTTVLGPVNGLDDLVWRGLVWAARKPFVMRGLPNFVAMRIDDCAGPFAWAHLANEVGFKPFLALFISDILPAYISDLRSLITNGQATASIHAFTGSTLFYFDHQAGTSYSDSVISNNFYLGTQWHLANSIPFSRNVIAHYSEIGPNAFAGLKAWGVEFVPIEVRPGTVEYGTPPAPWLVAGPYRRFETPQAGESNLPLYYADFLTVPGHPEFAGQFFNRYTEIRNTAAPGQFDCGEWCPSNDVTGSTNRATRQIKRALDSLVLASLFSHEWYIQNTPSVGNNNPITTSNWRAILQGITNNIAPYKPIYVTTEYADQYVRATRTSRLVSAGVELASGRVTAVLSGATDMTTSLGVFVGADKTITNIVAGVPAFAGLTSVAVATQALPPLIFGSPLSRTNDAGTTTIFAVAAGGLAPLTYRWYRNTTNAVADGTKVHGAGTSSMTISDLLGGDGSTYTMAVSNALGSVTSAPAILKVNDPIVISHPASRTNHAGTAAMFTVGAYGTAPAYQWLKGVAPVPGATGTVLTLPSVSQADAGNYSVSIASPYGSLTSIPATLTVTAPLLIRSFTLTQTGAVITWNAIPGRDYNLQRKSGLLLGNWKTLLPSIRATNSSITAIDGGGLPARRFYRVSLVP